MNKSKAIFGVRLKKLRIQHKLTQEQLGEIVGFSGKTIYNWESTDKAPNDLNALVVLADFFKVSLDYLLGRTDDKDGKVMQTTFFDDKGQEHTLEIEQGKNDKNLTLGQIQTVIKVLEKIGIDPNNIKLSSF